MILDEAPARAAAGNRKAGRMLYTAYSREIYYYCLSLLGEKQAKAAFVAIFDSTWSKLSSVKGNFGDYIRNTAVSYCASKMPKDKPVEIKTVRSDEPVSVNRIAEDGAPSEELAQAITQALSKLPGKERAAVLLNLIAGADESFIAEALKLDRKAVADTLSVGLETLRRQTEADLGGLSRKDSLRFNACARQIVRTLAAAPVPDGPDSGAQELFDKYFKKELKLPGWLKIALPVLLLAALITVGIVCFGGKGAEQTGSTTAITTTEAAQPSGEGELLSGLHHIEIEVQDYGVISVELNADVAPITVTNFIDLINAGFYNGLTFHRIIYGFMIQGGDPLGTGYGGSDKNITGEFSYNGIENSLSHTRGAISMARSGNSYDSASSQFFIVHQDSTALDGQYAAFGYVTDGMEWVDAIATETPTSDSNGAVKPENQPVITEIRVLD